MDNTSQTLKYTAKTKEYIISITENTRLTFGKHGPTRRRSGKKLKECPKSYLQWMVDNLRDTDFHEWALAAQKIIETRTEEDAPIEDLEKQADEILRDAGFL